MSVTGGIEIDTRQFEKAMLEYQQATGKTFRDVVVRSVQNLGFQGYKIQAKADAVEIRALKGADWWPKYIAMVARKTGKVDALGASRIHQSAWAKKNVKRKEQTQTQYRYQEMMREISARILGSRVKGINFMRAFWLIIGNTAAKAYKGGRAKAGKSFSGMMASGRNGGDDFNPSYSATAGYYYRKRTQRTSKRTETLLRVVLQRAYDATARDMIQYSRDRMKKDAQKHSART